jgi:hypothetical protein
MPYKRRADKLAYMRAYHARRKREASMERRQENRARSLPQHTPPSPGSPALPVPPGTQPAQRRALREQYAQLRQLGLTDEAAQAILRPRRETEKEVRQRQAQAEKWERDVASRVPAFREPAHYWLRVHAGCFTEADVERKAREFAEQEVHSRQKPRLPDSEPPAPSLLLPSLRQQVYTGGQRGKWGGSVGDNKQATTESD